MNTPFTPYFSWGAEQQAISSQLASPNDGLGGIIEHVSCSAFRVCGDHPHVQYALRLLEPFPIPCNFEEFYLHFKFREWDMVCKYILLAIRLKILKNPNPFQRFLLGIYIEEHKPICCCACGLIKGIWCGK